MVVNIAQAWHGLGVITVDNAGRQAGYVGANVVTPSRRPVTDAISGW